LKRAKDRLYRVEEKSKVSTQADGGLKGVQRAELRKDTEKFSESIYGGRKKMILGGSESGKKEKRHRRRKVKKRGGRLSEEAKNPSPPGVKVSGRSREVKWPSIPS